jgi:hypothetical protein
MASRREVMDYADRHGAKAAGERYGVPAGTVRSWRSRARKRAARDGTAPPTRRSGSRPRPSGWPSGISKVSVSTVAVTVLSTCPPSPGAV